MSTVAMKILFVLIVVLSFSACTVTAPAGSAPLVITPVDEDLAIATANLAHNQLSGALPNRLGSFPL